MLKNWEHVKKTPQPFSHRENGTLQICVYGCGSHSSLRGDDFTLTLSHDSCIYLSVCFLHISKCRDKWCHLGMNLTKWPQSSRYERLS